jgi:molecular chaperone GrpE
MTHTKDEDIINDNENQIDFDNIDDKLQEEIKKAEETEQKESIKNWSMFLEMDKFKKEIDNLKLALARSQADYQNLLMRAERDKTDMTFFIASNLLTKILPFIDNLERLINNTPENLQNNSLYEWIKSVYNGFIKQLETMWIKSFNSIWMESDHDLHEVISQAPWNKWIIIQELEKWYKLQDKVIRYAKVIIWNWNIQQDIQKE